MRVVIASDHAGYMYKQEIKKFFEYSISTLNEYIIK